MRNFKDKNIQIQKKTMIGILLLLITCGILGVAYFFHSFDSHAPVEEPIFTSHKLEITVTNDTFLSNKAPTLIITPDKEDLADTTVDLDEEDATVEPDESDTTVEPDESDTTADPDESDTTPDPDESDTTPDLEQSTSTSTPSVFASPTLDLSWVDPTRPVIALTFDDGPRLNGTSDKIYAFLTENQIHATFFLLGESLIKATEAIPLILESGSQIANHTYHHYDLTTLTAEQIKEELQLVLNIFDSLNLTQDYYYVRVPYGSYNSTVLASIPVPIIGWNRDSEDWKATSVEEVLSNIGQVKDGDILLFHDVKTITLEALEVLIPQLEAQGFQFLTVEEMFAYKGIELEAGKLYYNAAS